MIETKIEKIAVRWSPPSLPAVWVQVAATEAISEIKKLENTDLKDYILTIKKHRKKSLNANAYMWQLCTKIAEKIRATKEDVYKKAIREVGWYMDMSVEAGKEEEAKSLWSMRGVGWFAEDIFCSRKFSEMRFYKGSSVYNSEEMRRLIDYIVDEATELGIETMTPMEIERLNQLWEGEAK